MLFGFLESTQGAVKVDFCVFAQGWGSFVNSGVTTELRERVLQDVSPFTQYLGRAKHSFATETDLCPVLRTI